METVGGRREKGPPVNLGLGFIPPNRTSWGNRLDDWLGDGICYRSNLWGAAMASSGWNAL